MRTAQTEYSDNAEVTALKALGFLAAEPERLQRFLDLSGLGVQAIRKNAADRAFLGGLLDYLLADQTLLLLFAESEQIPPGRIAQFRRQLPGASDDF